MFVSAVQEGTLFPPIVRHLRIVSRRQLDSDAERPREIGVPEPDSAIAPSTAEFDEKVKEQIVEAKCRKRIEGGGRKIQKKKRC